MSDLRSDIWSDVLTAARYHPVDDTAEMQFAREEAKASEMTDRIIATVREALLSHDAVGRAIIAQQTADHESPMAAAITAALNAALGTEDES